MTYKLDAGSALCIQASMSLLRIGSCTRAVDEWTSSLRVISRMARNPERTTSWSSAMRMSVTSRHPFLPPSIFQRYRYSWPTEFQQVSGETLTFSEARARCRAAPTGGVARAHFRVFY